MNQTPSKWPTFLCVWCLISASQTGNQSGAVAWRHLLQRCRAPAAMEGPTRAGSFPLAGELPAGSGERWKVDRKTGLSGHSCVSLAVLVRLGCVCPTAGIRFCRVRALAISLHEERKRKAHRQGGVLWDGRVFFLKSHTWLWSFSDTQKGAFHFLTLSRITSDIYPWRGQCLKNCQFSLCVHTKVDLVLDSSFTVHFVIFAPVLTSSLICWVWETLKWWNKVVLGLWFDPLIVL